MRLRVSAAPLLILLRPTAADDYTVQFTIRTESRFSQVPPHSGCGCRWHGGASFTVLRPVRPGSDHRARGEGSDWRQGAQRVAHRLAALLSDRSSVRGPFAQRFRELVNSGFYNGCAVFRVIPGAVAGHSNAGVRDRAGASR